MSALPDANAIARAPLAWSQREVELRDQVDALSLDLHVANAARERAEHVVGGQHDALHLAFEMVQASLKCASLSSLQATERGAELDLMTARAARLEIALEAASEQLLFALERCGGGTMTTARIASAAARARAIAREGR